MKPTLIDVVVMDQYGNSFPGKAEVTLRSSQDAIWYGGKKAAKIIGIIILILFPFGFLEPFLFMIWGSISLLFLLSVLGPYLHFRFSSETKSFSSVKSICPYCNSEQLLKPYLSTRFESNFTVICTACGQTAQVSA